MVTATVLVYCQAGKYSNVLRGLEGLFKMDH